LYIFITELSIYSRFADIDDVIERMRLTLQWGHIAPSCPDTLPCFPYSSEEPFLLNEINGGCPHVYFCGNQDIFQFSKENINCCDGTNEMVTIISVPKFSLSGTIGECKYS
jgi:DNA polymerase delta subunit 2